MIRTPVTTLLRLGAATAALSAFVAAVSAGPVDATTPAGEKNEMIEKAGAAFTKGQFDEAYKLLQEAVKKSPQLPPARLMLARMFAQVKDMGAQARQTLELASAENSDHPEIYLQQAEAGLQEGRITDAILNCQVALQLAGTDRWTADQKKKYSTGARGMLTTAYESRKDWASARTHLSAWLDIDGKNAAVQRRLAQAQFFLGKPDDAHATLKDAIKNDPMMDSPAVIMGKLWTAKGDFKKAREWLEQAANAGANSVRVKLAYADWLLQQNETEQAKIHVDAAFKLEPKNVDVLKLKGLVARIQRKAKDAETIFQDLLTNTPGDFFVTNQLALLLADNPDEGQRSRAVKYAELNASANQRSAEAIGTLGYVYFRVGKVEEAARALGALLNSGQISSDTAYFSALVFADNKKWDDAHKLLEGALKANGLFVYRDEARKLQEKIAPNLTKDKDKEKPADGAAKSKGR